MSNSRSRAPALAIVVLGLLAAVVLLPGLVTDWGVEQRTGSRLAGASGDHWLGTDALERDVLSRVLHGGRTSLAIGLAAAVVASTVGLAVGLAAGAGGGRTDDLLMRLTDLFLAAPAIVVLLVLSRLPDRQGWARAVLGDEGSARLVVTLLSLVLWMPTARVVRGVVRSVREQEFVLAARAIGMSPLRIARRHLLPHCRDVFVLHLTLAVAAAIVSESAVSFLGFGVDAVTTPTWGNLLQGQAGALAYAPELVLGPAGAIVVTVLCVNVVGEWLRTRSAAG